MSIKILLDPGHGQGRAHNRGFLHGDNEGDVNYNYSTILRRALESRGFVVGTTRPTIGDNPSLDERGAMGQGYDLLLSLHSNAMGTPNSGVRGTEIWDSVQKPNRVLAEALCKAISDALNIPNRGVKYRKQDDGRDWYGVLRASKAKSAMLVEHFFHDNAADVSAWWRSYKQVAEVTADVLAAFYHQSSDKEYTAQEFIDVLAPMAIADWKKSGILPSVTIAQGMVESANGNSELARKANNLFGIKASAPWTGEKYRKITSEYTGTKYVQVEADFRKYKSWEESVKDHGAFFRSTPARVSLYKHVYTATTWQAAVNALTGTYATSPTYAQSLTDRITRYGLDEYDRKPQHMDRPYYGVFALNSADQAQVEKIIQEVRGAVRYNRGITPEEMFDEVVQVGGAKLRPKYVHLAGSNREETAKAVEEWTTKNR